MPRSKQDSNDDDRKRAFATALSDAINAKEMTLGQLSARLTEAGTPASPATLSYWQNGHSMPTRGRSAGVLAVLEQILEVPQGYFTRFLTHGAAADWRARDVVDEPNSAEQVLAGWGLSLERRVVSVAVQDIDRVQADGRTTTSVIRRVVRGEGELERALPLILSDEGAGSAPIITVLHGATLGRHIVDLNGSRLIAEIVLNTPLRRGEHTWFEYQIDWHPTPVAFVGRNERLLPLLTDLLTLDVVFEGDLPADIIYWSEPADGSARKARRLVPVNKQVQVVLPNVAPGDHCIQWTNDPYDPEFAAALGES